MRTPQYIIKLAADDVSKLRRVDVMRVLDNCSNDEIGPTVSYIRANRPDLSAEVNEVLAELSSEGR